MTARALAEKTGLVADTISRLELGTNKPDDATVAKLAHALEYPEGFFRQSDPHDIDLGAVSFRSFSKMSARERDAAVAAGSLGLQLGAWVESRFDLPAPDLLDLSQETDPEMAAIQVRQHWGLGERPISNMMALLETKGVRMFSLSENTASVNAFSFWRDGKPYIFLNDFKTSESSILDSAHELAHLVLHRHAGPTDTKAAEREANQFASAFLMPARDVRATIRRPFTVEGILAAKARWRVSAMALTFRLHSLRILSDWQYRSLCIELARRGYRSGEPVGVERETSLVWRKVLTQLWSEKTTKHDIARDLHMPVDELEGLIWKLAGTDPAPSLKQSGLRLVK